jgi:membrane protein YqaA with SNARE-associated domain
MSEVEKSPPALLEVNGAIAKQPSKIRSWVKRRWVTLTTITIVLILSLVIYLTGGLSDDISAYGYLGVFLISLLATTVFFLPLPNVPIVFLMGAILNPFLVGLIAGIGESIGEITGYTAGLSGKEAPDNKKQRYTKIKGLMRRRGTLMLFLFSAIPNPFFKLVGISAGTIRYPFWKFLLVVLAGKTVKGMAIALLGYWALLMLLKLII